MNSLKLDRSWIEVDLIQLVENYKAYINALPKNFEIMAVVKADAYGHGAVSVANALSNAGVSKFAVSNLNEAIELRESGIDGEILILGYTPAAFAKELCEYNIIQTVVSEEHAAQLAAYSDKRLKCHVAIDTGMHRIGLDADNPDACADIIRRYSDKLNISGMYTHFCVSDSLGAPDREFTLAQIGKLKNVCDRVADVGIRYVHCCNSADGLYYSEPVNSQLFGNGTVRLGIVLYGLKPDVSNKLPDGINPVLSWKTAVTTVKTLQPGDSIGYGRTYIAERTMQIATLSTGYADGYRRDLSNKGYVLIRGRRAPIVGRICMDQMTVDVSDIPGVKAGDFATLIGNDGNEKITADDIASLIGTIGYEIVCGISKRVERTCCQENL
ncbi:MAG: alanine racemase [Clostridia bacterium]|nr:alanine racemase [Clostridia bacterium]